MKQDALIQKTKSQNAPGLDPKNNIRNDKGKEKW